MNITLFRACANIKLADDYNEKTHLEIIFIIPNQFRYKAGYFESDRGTP